MLHGRARRLLAVALLATSAWTQAAPAQEAKYETSLDPTFGGGDGIVTTSIGGNTDMGHDVATGPGGRIYVAGSSFDNVANNWRIAVAAYHDDGSLDPSFGGGDGVVTTAVGTKDEAKALAVQPDGKVVVAGSTFQERPVLVVARYTTDGSLDPTFGGGDGVVTLSSPSSSGDMAEAMALQPDGRIVVAGTSFSGQRRILVARFRADGTPDPEFGTGGVVTTVIGRNSDEATGVALQSDGRVLVVGSTFVTDASRRDFAAVRYLPNGVLDASFGGDGIVTTSVGGSNDAAANVAFAPDGGSVVVGTTFNREASANQVAVVKYRPDGALDSAWGGGGIVTTSVGGSNDTGADVAVHAEGRVVVAGSSFDFATSRRLFALVGYTSAGMTEGWVTTSIGSNNDQAAALALQGDHRMLVAGTSFVNSRNRNELALVRYVERPRPGYWLVARDGGVFTFGQREFHGSGASSSGPSSPIVAAAGTDDGYWLLSASGRVQAFGVPHYGDGPTSSAVGIAATPSGRGYWVTSAAGDVFAFGDAVDFGGMDGHHLNGPIVSIASTPSGRGYWLVGADGGVFSFGDAPFFGSMAGVSLGGPMDDIAATADGKGYVLSAKDGGVFAFGSAGFFGSAVGRDFDGEVVGIVLSAGDAGYWLTTSRGEVFNFGSAGALGSMAGTALNEPVIDLSS